jgi:hypothetical protein
MAARIALFWEPTVNGFLFCAAETAMKPRSKSRMISTAGPRRRRHSGAVSSKTSSRRDCGLCSKRRATGAAAAMMK